MLTLAVQDFDPSDSIRIQELTFRWQELWKMLMVLSQMNRYLMWKTSKPSCISASSLFLHYSVPCILQTPGELEHDKDPLLEDDEVVCPLTNS